MSVFFGIVIFGLSSFFADERAAYVAAHDFCEDAFVTRENGVSRFQCEGVDYVVQCAEGTCDVREEIELASAQ